MPEKEQSILEIRKLNIEDAIRAMNAPTVSKLHDLVFCIDQVLEAFDDPDLGQKEKDRLNNLRWETNELREYLHTDIQIRSLEYENELKQLNPK
ncbi:MAG: hypothetical protein WD361_14975 [Gracilimonas sp.]